MAARKFLTGIDLAGQKATNLADGSSAADAATYGQLLNLLNGLDFKNGVQAASTANITVASPGATIDGVTLTSGDRVLLKNQTTTTENGLWVFNGSASPLTRSVDGVTGEITQGATVVVTGGTANAQTQWTLSTSGVITVGTTAQTWVQSGGVGQTYTAGNGIAISSNSVAVNPAASGGLAVAAGGVSVDRTKVPMLYAQNVGDGSTTAIVVTHNLNTRDVFVRLYDAASYVEVETDVAHTSTATITLTFATAPASNAYRVVVHG